MRLETLVEFSELAHCLNYTEASKNLHISQPNLSKHISELEKELGFELFTKGRKIHLTLAGKSYLSTVCNIIFEHEMVLQKCKQIIVSGGTEVRLLEPFSNNESSEILQKAARFFLGEHPQTGVVFIDGKRRNAVEAIIENIADIAITIAGGENTTMEEQAEKTGLIFEPILTVPLYVWLNMNHKLAEKERITIEELSTSTTIMSIANKANDPFRLVTRGLFCTKPSWTILGVKSAKEFYLHANEYDVALITPSLAKDYNLAIHEDMVIRPIADDNAVISYYIVYDGQNGDDSKFEMARIIYSVAKEMQDKYPSLSNE